MGQLLIRDLDAEVIDRLKTRAANTGDRWKVEAKAILEAAPLTMGEAHQLAEEWQQRLWGRSRETAMASSARIASVDLLRSRMRVSSCDSRLCASSVHRVGAPLSQWKGVRWERVGGTTSERYMRVDSSGRSSQNVNGLPYLDAPAGGQRRVAERSN
jgi:plasmid stability protein